MALQYRHVLSLGLALVLVAACERPSAVADKTPDQAPVQSLREAAPARTAEAGRNEAPVRELDGRPIWSSMTGWSAKACSPGSRRTSSGSVSPSSAAATR